MPRDMFGAETGTISESATATAPPAPAEVAAAAATAAPAAAPAAGAPTLQQAVDKAVAKTEADKAVAASPHAFHHVQLSATAPVVLGAAAAGAGIGFMVGGPPGAAIGAAIGFVEEKYQLVSGGILGTVIAKGKALFNKTPPAAPPAAKA